jgi:hypothetical protein
MKLRGEQRGSKTAVGLTKKERREKRDEKLATKRAAKRSERNAFREAIGDFVAGATDEVATPESRRKKGKGTASDPAGSIAAPRRGAPSTGGPLRLEPTGPARSRFPSRPARLCACRAC